MWEFGRRTRVIVSMCATFPNGGGFPSITVAERLLSRLCLLEPCSGLCAHTWSSWRSCTSVSEGEWLLPRQCVGPCLPSRRAPSQTCWEPSTPLAPLCAPTLDKDRRESGKDRFFPPRQKFQKWGEKSKDVNNWKKKELGLVCPWSCHRGDPPAPVPPLVRQPWSLAHVIVSSISSCRWSAQTHADRRALRLQRQRGPPPLEPETLRSSRRGEVINDFLSRLRWLGRSGPVRTGQDPRRAWVPKSCSHFAMEKLLG